MRPILWVTIAAAVVAVLALSDREVSRDPPATEKDGSSGRQQGHLGTWEPAGAVGSSEAIRAPSQNSSGLPTATKDSKAQDVRALIARNDPRSSYVAYRMVRNCLDAKGMEVDWKQHPERFRVTPPTPAEACGDIDAGQLSSRLIYLRHAARFGVQGAAAHFVMEGPDGEGVPEGERAELPLVKDWWAEVEQVVQAGASKGDVYSLQAMAMRYESDPLIRDMKTSWAYWIVANQMQTMVTGKPFPTFARIASATAKTLSDAELAESNLIAARLLAGIKEKSR